MSGQKVWICGKWVEEGSPWEFQGVFDSEENALAACATDDYFIGPAIINERLPDGEYDPWPGLYYPFRQSRPASTVEEP